MSVKKMRFKPEFDNEDAHEYHRRMADLIDEPNVCLKCRGTGKIDTDVVTICSYCEGEGVVYE